MTIYLGLSDVPTKDNAHLHIFRDQVLSYICIPCAKVSVFCSDLIEKAWLLCEGYPS